MKEVDSATVARSWIKAFNEHNLESLLKLYHDDAQHYSPKLKVRMPETGGLIRGKVALRSWWSDAFHRLPTLQYELIQLTPASDRVFMEYIRHTQGEVDLAIGEVLELKEGLIIFSRVYHG